MENVQTTEDLFKKSTNLTDIPCTCRMVLDARADMSGYYFSEAVNPLPDDKF